MGVRSVWDMVASIPSWLMGCQLILAEAGLEWQEWRNLDEWEVVRER